MDMKQVIIVRNDLKMSKGKMAAQVSHASVEAVLRTNREDLNEWREQGMKKVVLKVETLKELIKVKQDAKDQGLVSCMIKDAGMTELTPGTITCVAVGPDKEDKVDAVTGHLKMV